MDGSIHFSMSIQSTYGKGNTQMHTSRFANYQNGHVMVEIKGANPKFFSVCTFIAPFVVPLETRLRFLLLFSCLITMK